MFKPLIVSLKDATQFLQYYKKQVLADNLSCASLDVVPLKEDEI